MQYDIPQNARVVVTGGTGFTGSHLLRRLVALGSSVRAVARHTSTIPQDLHDVVEWTCGDLCDVNFVRSALHEAEYVFHVAACFRDSRATEEDYRKIHVDATRVLAKESARLSRFKRFVHVSTVGVHGHIENPPGSEDAPYAPGDVYQRTKLEGELWIREFAEQAALPLVVIRPAGIMGAGDRRLLKLFRFAKMGWFPLVDGKNRHYHLMHVEDLCRSMTLAAVHPAGVGEVYISANEEPSSFVDIMTTIGSILNRQVRFVSIPGTPLFNAIAGVEALTSILGMRPVSYRRRLEFFVKDRAFDTSKMRDHLGFQWKYNTEEGIRATARAYLEAGWL